MGSGTHYVVAILGATIAIGVMVQLLKNPTGANQLFAAGADSINGIIHGLEG